MKVTFSVACLLGLASAESHYGNPANGCEDDEEAVKVTGISGSFCSPDCTNSSCPTDVPSGVTAEPQCALKTSSGDKACALICSASTDEASLRAGDAECGEATCQPIQGTGICTYDNMGTSPSKFTVFTAAKKVGDEAKCIADIEALIPGVEKAIADLKAGKQTAFKLDMLLLLPKAEAAYKECTASGKKNPKMHHMMKKLNYMVKNGKPEDLPTCIADLEAMIPAVEKIIADFKAGDYPSCLTDALTLLPEAEKAYTDCTASKPFHNGKDHHKINRPQDLPTCIADLEGLIPGVEKVIADFKSGDYETALTDALALLPGAEKAATDCLDSKKKNKLMKLVRTLGKTTKVEDLPTCIADLEAMIPGVEKVIADFKSGDYETALTDALTLLPEAEKAYTDCTASTSPSKFTAAKKVGDEAKCIKDIETLIPPLEKAIADLKAKKMIAFAIEAKILLPKAEAAFAECLGGGQHKKMPKLHHHIKKLMSTVQNANPEDLGTCIADLEAMIPAAEQLISDFKAGDYTKCLTDAMTLLPEAEKAFTDCTASKEVVVVVGGETHYGNPADGCEDDEEAVKVTGISGAFCSPNCTSSSCPTDVPSGVTAEPQCALKMSSGGKSCALICSASTDEASLRAGDAECGDATCQPIQGTGICTYSNMGTSPSKFAVFTAAKPQDLPTCIADLEAMLPGVEKIIADFKAGNYDTALTDAMALLPDAEKAFTDCTASAAPKVMRKLHHFKKFASKINVGDLPTCIADLEAMIPAAEQLISDFKAGDYNKCLTDALTLLPEAEKAYTDCTASAKAVGGRFKTILKDDPKREYFEKMGAEFATGFLAGTKVGRFDSIDLYECLHREPTAVEIFYKADEEFKFALVKKDAKDAIKAIDEMIYFIIELIKEDYPRTHVEVCRDFKSEDAQWGDLELILKELKDPQTTLEENSDRHIFFNKMDITSASHSIVEDYLKSDFGRLGYNLGDLLQKESKPASEGLFLY